jgi:GDSL-like Lipase/Acylhydrolase family
VDAPIVNSGRPGSRGALPLVLLGVALGATALAYVLLGHWIIRAAYDGGLPLVGRLMRHRATKALPYYYAKADRAALACWIGLLIACVAAGLCAWSARSRRVFVLLLVNAAIVELVLQAGNLFYPLFRPARLVDTYENQWLAGFDWMNGATRLYVYKQKAGATTYGHPFHVNHWGFRGPDFLPRAEVGTNTFRIMVLGDSLTAGIGVAEPDRFTEVLERELEARYPGVRFEVINLGVQGFETVQEYMVLRRMWPVVRPDLTIVGFFDNDPNLHYVSCVPHNLPVGPARGLLENLLSFRILDAAYGAVVQWVLGIPSRNAEIDAAYRPDSRDWGLFVKSVRGIDDFVRSNGGGQPVAIGLMDEQRAKRGHRYWPARRVFEQAGFAWVDWESEGPYEPVSRFEGHPNERTHARYARALLNWIVQKDILSKWREHHPSTFESSKYLRASPAAASPAS